MTSRNDTELLARFVAELNSRGLEPLNEADVPSELRTGELPDLPRWFRWTIREAGNNPWAPNLESSLPFPFPALYHLFVSRFMFAEFEVGPVMFLANTGNEGVVNELSRVWRVDRFPRTLTRHGFLQIGRRAGGWYDPVCFDMKKRNKGDAPIVLLDHEEVLMNDRIRVQEEIAPSFRAFAERVVDGAFRADRDTS